jgi:predicted DCC family thiol-disulfide oxidoreductase YuxK
VSPPDHAGGSVDVVDIVVYDGECGLCDRFVSFVLAHDRQGRFHFAPQQGAWARTQLTRHGVADLAASTVMVVTAKDQLLLRSRAVFHVLKRLPWPWSMLAWLRVLPAALTDAVYDQIARRRLRLFGRLETCRLPSPSERDRFMS